MKIKISLILAALNSAATALFIHFAMPDTVPTHYNIYGNADAYGTKWMYVFISIIPLLLSIGFVIYDRRAKTAARQHNKKYEDVFIVGTVFILMAIAWLCIAIAKAGMASFNASAMLSLTSFILGFIMLLVSNIYGKLKQNKYFGIKIPPTLKDEETWNKTHRFSGWLGFFGGIILLACAVAEILLMPENVPLLLILTLVFTIAIMGIVPTIYAYVYYNKHKK